MAAETSRSRRLVEQNVAYRNLQGRKLDFVWSPTFSFLRKKPANIKIRIEIRIKIRKKRTETAMEEYQLYATMGAGFESVVAKELQSLGYETTTENGRVFF